MRGSFSGHLACVLRGRGVCCSGDCAFQGTIVDCLHFRCTHIAFSSMLHTKKYIPPVWKQAG